ncbi:STAS domain-containing protein [Oceanobacillus halotolerans]|uniref:STAS domain-containing protein n=1 Tax=Oceanobacillus halotolerans TaxID=2663380 RepID=UPI0013DD11EE|nr:STAS domain-containing protein [Oceanobacillus halotolerans]
MDLTFYQGQKIREFLMNNRELFEEKLLEEAVNVRDKIEEIKLIGNINLVNNAHKLVLLVVDEKQTEVTEFAKQEGIVWAKFNLTLSFKLEWVQAIRRTLWHFLYQYDKLIQKDNDIVEFYTMENKVNTLIDEFLNNFFLSYSKYKDELIESQRQLVEKLSVPIIPINTSISILPLIGKIDSYRANIIDEKVLQEIGTMRVQTLIMDLSGIAQMDSDAVQYFMKLLDGISMMGCEAVITGMRSKIVRDFIKYDTSFGKNIETKGTLQQALKEYLNSKETAQYNEIGKKLL